MPKQRHDTGWKKRQKNAAEASRASIPASSPDTFALQLVLSGLASPQILDHARRATNKEQPK